jgi:hypothetical protein
MEFRRKKKRGQSQKARRTWFSDEGYRITWRKEVYGVRVPGRFQACVRVLVPYSDGKLRPMWDFVNRNRRLMKVLKAAEDECEKHKLLWQRACEARGIRALKELFGGKLPLGLPLWVRKKLDRRLYAILIDNRPMTKHRDDEEDESCTESLPQSSVAPGPGGPLKTSESSVLPTEALSAIPTPASPAEDKEPSTTRTTRRARSKATRTIEPSAAPLAEAAAEGQSKPAAKRTARRSKPTGRRKPSMTGSPASDARPSRGSRKLKSLPCGS